jgi:hypothetical protein
VDDFSSAIGNGELRAWAPINEKRPVFLAPGHWELRSLIYRFFFQSN